MVHPAHILIITLEFETLALLELKVCSVLWPPDITLRSSPMIKLLRVIVAVLLQLLGILSESTGVNRVIKQIFLLSYTGIYPYTLLTPCDPHLFSPGDLGDLRPSDCSSLGYREERREERKEEGNGTAEAFGVVSLEDSESGPDGLG